MTTKHTPGPLRITPAHDYLHEIFRNRHPLQIRCFPQDGDPAGITVAQMGQPSSVAGVGLTAAEIERFAALFAAAPDMLAALEMLVESLEIGAKTQDMRGLGAAWAYAEKIIAKAKGERT